MTGTNAHLAPPRIRASRKFGRVAAIAVVVLAAVVGVAAPSYYTGILTEIVIFTIFALSLNLLIGYAGLPSFCHAAFFGTAGYSVAILFLRGIDNFWICASVSIVASVLLAAVFGLLALRTTGAYFVMITLGLGQIVRTTAVNWRSVTKGDDGLVGIARPDLGFLPWSLADPSNFFLFCLAVAIIVAFALYIVVNSPFGYALQGIRESESRMRALGYNTWLFKYLAFLLSGAFAGIGGVLFVYYNGFITPTQTSIQLSAEGILMVIVGGAGQPFGPIFGVIVIVLMRDIVSSYADRWLLLLGIIFVLVALFARRGVPQAIRDILLRKPKARQ